MSVISMKHIKRFNNLILEKSLSTSEVSSIERSFRNVKITPKADQVPINNIYSLIFIELESRISISGIEYKYIVIDSFQSGLYYYNSLDDACLDIPEDWLYHFNINDEFNGWDDFTRLLGNKFVTILDYNDINFAEIENIFLENDISIDNIWAILT